MQCLSPVSVNDVFPWIETQGIHKKTPSALQPGMVFFDEWETRAWRKLIQRTTILFYFIFTKSKMRYLHFPYDVERIKLICVFLKIASLDIRTQKGSV